VLIAEKDKLDEAKASGLSAREIMKKDPKADGAMLRGIASATNMEGAPAESEITYNEAIGNIFLMALAGSATTGDTLHFAAVCLAANPDVQEWVLEELDQVVKEEGDNWTYQTCFPKLTRIHHVMVCRNRQL
jgi:cytochrome P450